MKNRILALTLLIVMLFTLSACSKKPEPAPAETPAPTAEPTPEPTPEPTAEPTPEPTPAGIEPDSGVHTIVSKTKNFSVDFDSKYVANELPSGSIIINAGMSEGIPYCTVGLMEKEINGVENVSDAKAYLAAQADGAREELGDAITAAPATLSYPIEGREIVGFYYSFTNAEAGGTVNDVYFAENLENGDVVVYHSSALEGADSDTVNEIIKLAIESFKLAA
jgi:predicted small lipoprotein YifL